MPQDCIFRTVCAKQRNRQKQSSLQSVPNNTELPTVCPKQHKAPYSLSQTTQSSLQSVPNNTELPTVCLKQHRAPYSLSQTTQSSLQSVPNNTKLPVLSLRSKVPLISIFAYDWNIHD
jgi:uncharacterized protein YjlB